MFHILIRQLQTLRAFKQHHNGFSNENFKESIKTSCMTDYNRAMFNKLPEFCEEANGEGIV
jgi:hypothetical protein